MDLVSPFLMKSWNPVPNREKAPTLSWLNPQYHPVGVLLIWFSQPIIESGVIILWSKIVVQKPFIILIQFLLTSPQLSLHVKLAVYGLSWLCPPNKQGHRKPKMVDHDFPHSCHFWWHWTHLNPPFCTKKGHNRNRKPGIFHGVRWLRARQWPSLSPSLPGGWRAMGRRFLHWQFHISMETWMPYMVTFTINIPQSC